jgi:hypothetical protein
MHVQWNKQVLLFPRREARQLMALPALLVRLQPRHPRPTLLCLVPEGGKALTHRRYEDYRGPLFSPEQFPARGTTWPGTQACAVAATRSHGAPPGRPHRLPSDSAGGMLPYTVPLWPPEHMPQGRRRCRARQAILPQLRLVQPVKTVALITNYSSLVCKGSA